MATITNQEYQNVLNYANSNYTADSLKNYSNAYKNYMSQWMSSNDAYNKASSLLVKSNTSTASTPTSTQTTATQSSANRNTTSTATSTNNNRNTGTYVDSDWYTSATQRNMATNWAEFGRSNTTQNQTSTPATSNLSNTKNMWDNLSYDQQQEKLNQIPWLKDSLTKRWWTIKSPTTQWTQQTPSGSQTNPWQWDYQDNSDARMMEIANNLNGYRISNPDLFNDWNTFSKFFIDGKGRSQDQISYLKDYFDAVKQYNWYDNMSAPSVWEMVARWEIPEWYLNYIKYANPDRYAEIMNYKDQTEKGIMNETYYANLVNNSDLADPEWMKWAKENQLIIDKNNDNLDDRLYHTPTEEEQTLVNEYSTLASEQLADQNTYRDLMSDLRKQYPDADESTLMILAWDRGKKIQDRMDTRNVTMTKLNGQIKYLQDERSTQDSAWQKTISELQKAYGLYYDYSPEWLSEYAQNKYAATNVTLEQAENWTDTQKQMALQSVLDGYYEKYWSIIQRSEAQVIWDIMKYAKDKWISLSQALEENFLKPLRSKPQFATLSAGGDLSSTYEPKIYKVWDNGYYFDENGNLIEIDTSSSTWWSSDWNLYNFTNYTPITEEDKKSKFNSFKSSHKEWSTWGECWSFVNDYLKHLWYSRWIGNSLSSKEAITNSDTATIWSVAVMNSSKHPSNGHVAIVSDIQWDKVKLLESNRNDDHKVHTTRWVNKSDILWYFDPSKEKETWWYNLWLTDVYKKFSDFAWDSIAEQRFRKQWGKTISDAWVSEKEFLNQYENWYMEYSMDAKEEILKNLDLLIEKTWWSLGLWDKAWAAMNVWSVGAAYNYIKKNLTLNKLAQAKKDGLKLWVLSDADVKMMADAASILWLTLGQWDWDKALHDFRSQLLKSNPELMKQYSNKSAYSDNTYFSYDSGKKSYSIKNSTPTSDTSGIKWHSFGFLWGSSTDNSGYSGWGKNIINLGR